MTDKILVLTSCESEKQASQLARQLVERRVAACVTILPKGHSIYRWKDKIEETAEWVLVIKSRRDLMDGLRTEIEQAHTYEVPEIIALPVVDGSDAYLAWIDAQFPASG